MTTRSALVPLLTLLSLTACGTAATPTGGASASGGASVGAPAPAASASDELGASPELPEVETEFPPACEVLTTDDVVSIVGNPVFDGAGFTSLICDWGSDAGDTSVSLLLQPVPAELCPDGLPEGEVTDQFGGQATVAYSDTANVPGAQVGVCSDSGLVLLTVTGGYQAPSDEARYTGQAVDIMELVLGRL